MMLGINRLSSSLKTELTYNELVYSNQLKQEQVLEKELLIKELTNGYSEQMNDLEDEITQLLFEIEEALVEYPSASNDLRKDLNSNIIPDPLSSIRIGEKLLLLRWITAEQLDYALRHQRIYGGLLGDILVHHEFLTQEQIQHLFDRSFDRLLLGERLLRAGHLHRKDLDRALKYQANSGGDIGEILLSMNLITHEQLYKELASQSQVGRLGQYRKEHADQYKIPEQLAREFNAIVIDYQRTKCVVAVEYILSPSHKAELEQHIGLPIVQVLASHWEMEILWSEIYHSELLDESVSRLLIEQPENSANVTFTKYQFIFFGVLLGIIVMGLIWDWFATLIILNIIIQVLYFSLSITKFMIIINGTRENAQIRIPDEEWMSIDEKTLPIYTILVPMYKESNVLPILVNNLNNLNYPKNKLDIRLLIEEDDVEAQEVIKSLSLPLNFKTIIVPDGLPKTKPKACNYGLIRARGEYVVIYDAEDRPDRDQLKKVYAAFLRSPESCVCIQAKLNYFNSDQNLLTRFFTQEYSNWFELLLPGVMQFDIPIPLGGTSNHFKTSVLRELNAWDPYNVTEDADLGIRLYKKGYTTGIVDSRTLEEANSRYGNWIRQRSRWIKGYMQTWLVHMRNPFKLYRELGLRGFLGAQLMLLSTPLLPLLNPIFWSLIIIWYATHAGWIPKFFPGIIYYLAAAQLLIGNFLFIFMNMAGTYWVVHDLHGKKERWLSYGLVKYALLTPIYWVFMSIASYKALWQLIIKPFYWEKTVHGLHTSDADSKSLDI